MYPKLSFWIASLLCASSVTASEPTRVETVATLSPSISVVLLTDTTTLDQDATPSERLTRSGCPKVKYDTDWPQVQVKLEGEFQSQPNIDQVVSRLTDFEAYTQIKYWSVSRANYHLLFKSSYGDPLPPATTVADRLEFVQNDTGPAGAMTQEMRFCEISESRLEVAIHNTEAAKFFWLTVIPERGYQLRILITPTAEQSDRYHYSSVLRIAGSERVTDPKMFESYGNRALALFAYLTAQDIELFEPVQLGD